MTVAPPDRYTICLTGNIATGKSTVVALLADLGATVIDADKVVHQMMVRGSPMHAQIVAAFGPQVLDSDGEIRRDHLGRIVFSDPAALRRLEEIVHPLVGGKVRRLVLAAETPVTVIEAIKLIEAGWHRECQALWVTTCPPEQQIERLMTDRALSFEDARQRVTAQPPQNQKISQADVVIDTSGEITETRRQVEVAWQAIITGGSNGPVNDVQGFPSQASRR